MDLREFIGQIEQLGEMRHVEGADWNLEIGAITELMAERKGPAVLFDKIRGYPPGYRVLGNAFATLRRTALLLRFPQDLNGVQMVDTWRKKLREFKPVAPVEVTDAPVKQNVYTGIDIDLLKFPAPKWHELDGGRYIGTGDAVITRDPDGGWVNVGTYRCMVVDRDTLTVKLNKGKHGRLMMEKYHAQGRSCPIAISFGQDPVLWWAASNMVPWGVSEYDFAGWMGNEPVKVVRGEVTDIPIPATAEIVIEGEIPPRGEVRPMVEEGPFGEWTGYYTDFTRGVVPVMKVKSVLHRDRPIILGAPPLKPPLSSHVAFPARPGSVWDALDAAGIPDVKGVWQDGSNHLWTVVAVKQRFAGHAKQAGTIAATCRAGAYGGRFVIVVDDDVDITNPGEVVWALSTRCNPESIDMIRDVWTSPADPLLEKEKRDREENTGAKLILNACRPYSRMNEFPQVVGFGPEYKNALKTKWTDLFT